MNPRNAPCDEPISVNAISVQFSDDVRDFERPQQFDGSRQHEVSAPSVSILISLAVRGPVAPLRRRWSSSSWRLAEILAAFRMQRTLSRVPQRCPPSSSLLR